MGRRSNNSTLRTFCRLNRMFSWLTNCKIPRHIFERWTACTSELGRWEIYEWYRCSQYWIPFQLTILYKDVRSDLTKPSTFLDFGVQVRTYLAFEGKLPLASDLEQVCSCWHICWCEFDPFQSQRICFWRPAEPIPRRYVWYRHGYQAGYRSKPRSL